MYRKPFCLPNMRVSCKCSFHPIRGLHCGLFTSQLENRHRSMQTDNRCKAPVVKLVGDHGREPFATFATIALLPVAHLLSPSSIPPWSKLVENAVVVFLGFCLPHTEAFPRWGDGNSTRGVSVFRCSPVRWMYPSILSVSQYLKFRGAKAHQVLSNGALFFNAQAILAWITVLLHQSLPISI